MRYILLKEFEIEVVLEGQKIKQNFSYRDYFLDCVKYRNPQDPMNFEEMEKAMTVVHELQKTEPNQVCALENADYEYLLQRLKASRFRVAMDELLEMKHDLESAPTSPLREAAPKK